MKGTGAELLVKCLESKGVKHAFGVSGTANLPLLDVIYKTPSISYIQTQHEQAAMFLANGYARMSRQPAICLVSPGPGTTNCTTGIAQAFYRPTPSILIAIEDSTKSYGLGTALHHSLDAVSLFQPLTRLATRIERTDRIPEWLHTAFRVASSGRKGPVYLGIPRDVLTAVAEVDSFPLANYQLPPPRGNAQDTVKAADVLARAKRPVALAGKDVTVSDANSELLELAELLAMPVAGTYGNKGVIPEDHPLALGCAGHAVTAAGQKTLRQADVLLAVECSFDEFTTLHFDPEFLSPRVKVIQIAMDTAEIGRVYPATVGILGGVKAVLRDIIAEVKRRKIDKRPLTEVVRIRELVQAKALWEESVRAQKLSDQKPIGRFRLMHDLRQALPREAIVGGESGSTHQWYQHAFTALQPEVFIGGWHPMGAEFCEALGAKVAAPEKIIVCITGDGSMMMSLSEWATAVKYNIAVLCVVCHNNLFGNMHYDQVKRFGSRFIGTDLPIPDLAAIARTFGAYGETVEQPDQIVPAVQRALNSGKPALLDVMLDTSPENLVPPRPGE